MMKIIKYILLFTLILIFIFTAFYFNHDVIRYNRYSGIPQTDLDEKSLIGIIGSIIAIVSTTIELIKDIIKWVKNGK